MKLLFPALLLISSAVSAGEFVSAHDGDTPTIKVTPDSKPQRYRLHGVDAPEIGQAFGDQARDETIKLCAGKDVQVAPTGKKSFTRPVARVSCGGIDLGRALVLAGLAWVDPRYAKKDTDKALYDAQATAQALKSGVWGNGSAVEPWIWRDAAKAKGACFNSHAGPIRIVNKKSEACGVQ